MSNKKTLAVTAFALLLSQQSFASETEGFYFGGGYHGQFFNSIGSLKVEAVKGSKHVTVDEMYVSDKITGQKPSEYKGDYNPPFAGRRLVMKENWVATAIELNWKECILL